jgi:hypothetical protein
MPTVTAQATTDQHDLLAMPPTITTTPLRIPRRRATGLLHLLHTLMNACTRGHRQQPHINPDYPRQETWANNLPALLSIALFISRTCSNKE